ncbi:MAG: PH domain-containing protein [Clostridium sp.]|nr:PH domain-containing protein [Clostridium sp.]
MKKSRNSIFTLIHNILSSVVGAITTCSLIISMTEWEKSMIIFGSVLLYIISVLSSTLNWFTNTFYLNKNMFHYKTGILNKKEIEIPIDNIFAVKLERNLKQRIFGLNALKIDIGAKDNIEEIRIVLRSRETIKLRKKLLRQEMEEKENTVYCLNLKNLILFSLTRNKLLDIIITSVGFIIFISEVLVKREIKDINRVIENTSSVIEKINSPFIILIIVICFLLVVDIITIFIFINKYYGFKIKQKGNLLEISSGFIEKKACNLNINQVFAVKTSQNIIQRINNKVTVSVSTFGYKDDGLEEAVIFPYIDKNQVSEVIKSLFPKLIYKNELNDIHKKYRLKYKNYKFGYNKQVIYLCGGILSKKTNTILMDAIEEVKFKQGYFQRKHNIYKLKIGYKGRKFRDLKKIKGVYKNHVDNITELILINE